MNRYQVRRRAVDRLRLWVESPIVQGASVATILVCGIALGLIVARLS